jgi:DNA-binding NarL/FixJ family response regulator
MTPNMLPSEAERVLLQEVARGYSYREIARHLGRAEQTIRNNVGRLCKQYNLDNRVQLTVLALAQGWVDLDRTWGDIAPRVPHVEAEAA